MNIPLNIDFQQILLHFFNFAILAFGLYILLYKPVKSFMDERASAIQKINDEARENREKAAKYEAETKARLEEAKEKASQESSRILNEARHEADLRIDKAKEEAEKIVSDAKASAQKEKNEIIHEADEEIAHLAAFTADKLIREALKDE